MNILSFVLICIIIVLGEFGYFEHSRVASWKANYTQCHNEFLQLAKDAKEANERYQIAYDAAQDQINAIQKQSNSIMKEKVSSNCNDAMVWLIAQGKNV